MMKKEQKITEAVLFAGMLFILMLVAGSGFQYLSGSQHNAFDKLKDISLNYQMKEQGCAVQYIDSGYMAYIEPTGYILQGLTIEQDFTVTEEMLAYDELAVGIKVGTYSRKNKVSLYVEIFQDSGFGKAYRVDCSQLKDNANVIISFPTEEMQAENCHVKVYSDATNGNHAVSLYLTDNCVLASTVKVAGTEEEKNLVMCVFTPYDAEKK